MSWALPTSRATAIDASNVCGSVLGLLMMALAWTYFPPTCWMTSAYSFSAPIAMTVPSGAAGSAASEDEQPAASRAAPARAASAGSLLQPLGIAGYSQVWFRGIVASNDNDSQSCLQRVR